MTPLRDKKLVRHVHVYGVHKSRDDTEMAPRRGGKARTSRHTNDNTRQRPAKNQACMCVGALANTHRRVLLRLPCRVPLLCGVLLLLEVQNLGRHCLRKPLLPLPVADAARGQRQKQKQQQQNYQELLFGKQLTTAFRLNGGANHHTQQLLSLLLFLFCGVRREQSTIRV